MVSSKDEEFQIRILKASLRQSDKNVSVMDRENKRARKLIEALEIRDVGKTKTIRRLKRRLKKPREYNNGTILLSVSDDL